LLLVNHIAPSGPAAILIGVGLPSFEFATGIGYSVNSTDNGGAEPTVKFTENSGVADPL
jgi:hypothetical protein